MAIQSHPFYLIFIRSLNRHDLEEAALFQLSTTSNYHKLHIHYVRSVFCSLRYRSGMCYASSRYVLVALYTLTMIDTNRIFCLAAISILEPNSQTTWYKNNTVQMTWGSATGDPNPFRILLNNSEGAMSANATLADSGMSFSSHRLTVLY